MRLVVTVVFFGGEIVKTREFFFLIQSSTHSMELIIIALIAVEVVIVRSFRLVLNLVLLIEQDWTL